MCGWSRVGVVGRAPGPGSYGASVGNGARTRCLGGTGELGARGGFVLQPMTLTHLGEQPDAGPLLPGSAQVESKISGVPEGSSRCSPALHPAPGGARLVVSVLSAPTLGVGA